MEQAQHTHQHVKRGDWVTCKGFSLVGFVRRVARDGSWADVEWHTHTKRMQTKVLEVQTTFDIGNGWHVTDLTREQELSKEKAHEASL